MSLRLWFLFGALVAALCYPHMVPFALVMVTGALLLMTVGVILAEL